MRILAFILVLVLSIRAIAIDFEGVSSSAIHVEAEAATGLDAGVFVVPSLQGVSISYTAQSSTASVKWYRFSNLGGAYAEEITSTVDGDKSIVQAQNSDMGYIVEEGSHRLCFWVIDYSAHHLSMSSLMPSEEQECGRYELKFSGKAEEIPYYTINGRRMVLSRELIAEYTTLRYDEASFSYITQTAEETFESIGSELHIMAPLCNTTVKLHGDKFLRAWGNEVAIESPLITPITVDVQTKATQISRDNDNEQKDGSADGLGGSAPCEITFEAAVSDAAVFTEWQISRSAEFEINENTFNELSFDYTFRENGTTYVRFVANNADGNCEYVGNTYEVFIGESRLSIPNAFSPEASPGVNDEWKVSYRSLVSYECHIFNRWGTRLFSSKDSAEGWDGKYAGKYVPAGVYFYVIKAEGADGIKYEKSGDINIIKYKEGSTTSGSENIE
ncbi:MAG: gliding motility-associated C-terminal domain-containing protein [Muribaculaceae bacterium]|nr:gliding motility-associated C-terminal domain-containing protein [Muribaculaceae bacterium]